MKSRLSQPLQLGVLKGDGAVILDGAALEQQVRCRTPRRGREIKAAGEMGPELFLQLIIFHKRQQIGGGFDIFHRDIPNPEQIPPSSLRRYLIQQGLYGIKGKNISLRNRDFPDPAVIQDSGIEALRPTDSLVELFLRLRLPGHQNGQLLSGYLTQSMRVLLPHGTELLPLLWPMEQEVHHLHELSIVLRPLVLGDLLQGGIGLVGGGGQQKNFGLPAA